MKYNFYVTINNIATDNTGICLHYQHEAIERDWIDEEGNRVYFDDEIGTNDSLVFGFDNYEKAKEFYYVASKSYIGKHKMFEA